MTPEEAGRGSAYDLMPSLDDALVGEFMHRLIVTCAASAPLSEVAQRMAEQRIHCVVVLQEFGRTGRLAGGWGIVSDLDLVGAAAAGGPEATAGELCASPVVTVSDQDSLREAARLMAEHDTAHLVVTAAGRDRPAGIISTMDVARCLGLAAGIR